MKGGGYVTGGLAPVGRVIVDDASLRRSGSCTSR
jgi:hypothetical protein